jgi:hypothetical protein
LRGRQGAENECRKRVLNYGANEMVDDDDHISPAALKHLYYHHHHHVIIIAIIIIFIVILVNFLSNSCTSRTFNAVMPSL